MEHSIKDGYNGNVRQQAQAGLQDIRGWWIMQRREPFQIADLSRDLDGNKTWINEAITSVNDAAANGRQRTWHQQIDT